MRQLASRRAIIAVTLAAIVVAAGVLATGRWRQPSAAPGTSGLRTTTPGSNTADLTALVNPFLGTLPGGSHFGFSGDSGDVVPAADYPLGMVQWGPDTPANLPGGYDGRDTKIKGFSLTHFSGRGCTVYQDFPFIPFIGTPTVAPPANPNLYTATFSHLDEAAHPGYYHVQLTNPAVAVDLTATARSGLGRFTFPPATPTATLLLDAGGSVNGVDMSSITIDPAHQEVTGRATSPVGCGAQRYTVTFAARFDQPFTAFGVWSGTTLQSGVSAASGGKTGAYLVFDASRQSMVQAQVGISFVGANHALANLDAEQHGFDFSAVRQAAHDAWNAKLSRITVQGGSDAERVSFTTAMYHIYIHPNLFSDSDGSYTGFDGQVHMAPAGHVHYENISSWDNYRTLIPLRALLDPAETADIAQSLVDDAVQGDGHLPRWEQANVDSLGMNGDSADIVLADIAAYGGTNFDMATALQLMLSGQPKVREGLSDYLSLGYVAASTTSNSAEITLEYSIDDFAISRFAAQQNAQNAATTYLQRSGSWRNVFNTVTNYVQPRQANGSWAPNFSPTSEAGFQEGDSAQYTWMVPFDLPDLIAGIGTNDNVNARLDAFFMKLNDGPESVNAFMGNEPSFGIPWVYDFTGTPFKTQNVVRRIQTTLFKSSSDGLPGNDDGGALSAWYIFSALGLYPSVPGVAGFVLGSPLFPSATLHLGNGQTVTISAPDASDDHPYVAGLKLNGQPTTSLWLPWSALSGGGTLNFALASTPTAWGTTATDAPPSFIKG